MWIAKLISDSESTRYSLFMVFSASGSIAFVWAAVAPWFFPIIFWGEHISICRVTTKFEPTSDINQWRCILTNVAVLACAGIFVFIQILLASKLFYKHYYDKVIMKFCICENCRPSIGTKLKGKNKN